MKEDLKIVLIGALIISALALIYGVSIDHQKTECLASGGKWVTGIVSGNYSAFCIPK